MTQLNQVLAVAARQGNAEVLQDAIKQSADVNSKDEKGYTPINHCLL
jgi:ankyrin repeat protein